MKASKMEDEFGACNSYENVWHILSILKHCDHSARRHQKKHAETFGAKKRTSLRRQREPHMGLFK